MKRTLLLLMLLSLLMWALPAAGEEDFGGQPYDYFVDYYSKNLTFINSNTGKHLIPLTISRGSDMDGHRIYTIPGDVVTATIRLDATGNLVELCNITLTSPEGLSYGDSLYNDFVVSGYHSYALLMAMVPDGEPINRYALVTEVNDGLSRADVYRTTVGHYRLVCTREGNSVDLNYTADWFEDVEDFSEDAPSENTEQYEEGDGFYIVPEEEEAPDLDTTEEDGYIG